MHYVHKIFYWEIDELMYEYGLKVEFEEFSCDVFRQREFPIYYKGKPKEVNRKIEMVICDEVLVMLSLY